MLAPNVHDGVSAPECAIALETLSPFRPRVRSSMRSASSILTLEHLSRLLLRIGHAGRAADAASFVSEVMDVLRNSLGFQFGWCGLVAERSLAYPVLQCVDGIRLPPSFVDELCAVAPRDDWGRGVVSQSAVVHRWSGFIEDDELVDDFVRRHDMFHGMAQSLRETFDGRAFVIAVYRERGASRFTDAEAEIFRHSCHHIGSLWWHCVKDALAADDDSADRSRLALVRNDGVLLYAGSAVCDALDRSGAQWGGTQLPADLVAALAARSPGNLRIGAASVQVQQEGSHFRMAVTDEKPGSPLSPREWRVARLFAAGQSYKEIARTLSLSPATVRSYLQSAYATLDVRNKVQLGRALARLADATKTRLRV
jgi:DNA-binding NarL/FixJ family response regulator